MMNYVKFYSGLFLVAGVILAFLSNNPFAQPVAALDLASTRIISAIFISTAGIVFAISNRNSQQ